MQRKTLLKIHLAATALAMLTISTFFISSLIAELNGTGSVIRAVKAVILYAVPILIVSMPALAVTGNKLAGTSKNPRVVEKRRRMKIIAINGIVLVSLAIFLYYQSHYQSIDRIFLLAQFAEFAFGLANLTLIGLNVRAGLMLRGRLGGNAAPTRGRTH